MSDPSEFGNTRAGGSQTSAEETAPTDWNTDSTFGQTVRPVTSGSKVFGRFELKRQLGRGGMGVVWLADDQRSRHEVALKFIPDMVRMDETAVADLRRETKRGMQMNHPNIVKVFDFTEDESRVAIVMEYVEGGTLAGRLLQQPARIFEVAALSRWVDQMLDALEYTHSSLDVFHRDLKPANLMIGADQQLKVSDFGIACSLRDSASRVSVKTQGAGTLLYMSPQQLLGSAPTASDDIYALGATLYELLTSKPPFHGGDLSMQLQTKIPASMTERRREYQINGAPIPSEWENAIAACLAKDPSGRPLDIPAVRAALKGQPFARGKPKAVAAPRPTFPTATVSTAPLEAAKPKPKWIWVASAAAVLAAGITVAALTLGGSSPPADSTLSDRTEKQKALANDELAKMQKRFDEVKQLGANKTVDQQAREWRKFYDDIKNYSTIYNTEVEGLKDKVKKLTEGSEQEVQQEEESYKKIMVTMEAEGADLIKEEGREDKAAALKEKGWHDFLAKWNTDKVPEAIAAEHEGMLQMARDNEQEWAQKAGHERQTTNGLGDLFTDPQVTAWHIEGKEILLKQAQAKLKAEGVYSNAVDGEYRPETADAIVRYQQRQALPMTGKLDKATLDKLGITRGADPTPVVAHNGGSGKSGGTVRNNVSTGAPTGQNGNDKATRWVQQFNSISGKLHVPAPPTPGSMPKVYIPHP